MMAKGDPKQRVLISGESALTPEQLAHVLGDCALVVRAGRDEATAALSAPDAAAVVGPAEVLQTLGEGATAMLDAMSQSVCLCAPDGRIVWRNNAFAALDEDTQRNIADACARGRGAMDGEGATVRLDVASAAGDRRFEVAISPVRKGGESASQAKMVGVAWDVTESRLMQEQIEAIDRAGRDLVGIEARAVREMNAAERLGMLQERIARAAFDLMHMDHFSIRLLDEQTGRLDIVMSVGFSNEATEKTLQRGEEGQGISGYVAATGLSYLSDDVSVDPRYVPGLEKARSSLTVPLRLQDQVIGVFNIESVEVGAFTARDRTFAEIFARYIAIALHILDLLVLERWTTNEAVSGRVEGEVSEPLEDLAIEAEWLRRLTDKDPEAREHIERVLRDVESIRKRLKEVARGPKTILGADRVRKGGDAEKILFGKRVLVADDEPAIRETIRDVLHEFGCTVVTASTGAEAVREVKHTPEMFDLVISDIMMPDKNGYEVFSAVKHRARECPVILMTGFGYDPHHSIVRASQEGLSCVLFKPFQAQRLVDEVRKSFSPEGAKT